MDDATRQVGNALGVLAGLFGWRPTIYSHDLRLDFGSAELSPKSVTAAPILSTPKRQGTDLDETLLLQTHLKQWGVHSACTNHNMHSPVLPNNLYLLNWKEN